MNMPRLENNILPAMLKLPDVLFVWLIFHNCLEHNTSIMYCIVMAKVSWVVVLSLFSPSYMTTDTFSGLLKVENHFLCDRNCDGFILLFKLINLKCTTWDKIQWNKSNDIRCTL